MWIRPETADNTCQDYVRDCVAWRNMGECERNRGYMIQYCRQACNFCRRDNIPLTAPTPTLPPLTLPPPTLPPPTKQSPSPKLPKKAQKNPKIEQKDTNCVDRHSLCSFWSTLNACATNSVYMQENCFMSCNRNICHEGVILLPASECVDKNADCGYWAAVGECERNSFFMNWKCPKACSHCTLDQ
uniref:ShKT domain-containing protein n=1 Tax=Plectus sambesii TaxID=2011161 RepID=A0A914X6T0_9BILA